MKIKRYITEAQLNEWGNADDYTELGTNAIVNGKKPDGSSTESGKSNPESTSTMNDKRVDNTNNDEGESKSVADNIKDVFKNVDARKPKLKQKFKGDLAKHITDKLGLTNAAQFIDKLPADFVQEFAKSIGKNALCYKDNLFLNMMNNPDFETATSDSKSTFERMYNLVISMDSINNTDGLKWIRSGLGEDGQGCILYLPELWKYIDDSKKLAQIINHDFGLYTKKDDEKQPQQTQQSESLIIEGDVNGTPHQQLIQAIRDRNIDDYIINTIKEPIARTGNDSEVALNSLKKVVASGSEDSLTGIFNNLTKDEPNSKKMSQFIINKYKENNANKDS